MNSNYTVSDCRRCPKLVENRSQIVDGVGPMDADIVLIGEAPGANEDEKGEPFIGKSGDILDEMLSEAGLERDDIRITNSVRCRPPDNRDPTEEECSNCSSYLVEEIQLIEPAHIIAMGATALETLTGADSISVLSDLGNSYDIQYEDIDTPVIACPHPAALIYRPEYKDDIISLFETLSG